MSQPATDTPADPAENTDTTLTAPETPPAAETAAVNDTPEPAAEDKKAKGGKKEKAKPAAPASSGVTVEDVEAFQAAAEALRKKLEATGDMGAASSNVTYALGLVESPLNYLRTVLKSQTAEA